MRAIWKGAVSFGLVNVPVRLYTATQENDIRFHQVHREDGGRIRQRRICSIDGEEVPYDEIAKGYETADGRMIILTDEDFAELPVATGREIEVHEFVPEDQIDPIMLGKTYYLEPDAAAAKPYALLRQALLDTERMAIVSYALRNKESLAVLRVRDDVILLQQMLWPDEIRVPQFETTGESAKAELRPQEVKMAASLVESLAADFEPEKYTDHYREAVEQLIEAKLAGGDVTDVPAAQADAGTGGAEVVDLLTALQNSVERARAGRGDATDEKPAPRKRSSAKKSDEAKPAEAEEAAEPKRRTRQRKSA
jgi:DNA end-binding protein Ku